MDVYTVVAALILGLVLSLSTGLRAFLAPFGLSFAVWMGWLDLGPQLQWMGSPLAVGTFGAAILFEMAADKFPAVDHVMDVLHVFVKPVAGALVAYAATGGADPLVASVAALATGGVIAGGTHLAKASVRVGSTTCTVGTCNPVISVVEDIAAVALAGAGVVGAAMH
jgi:uncharacterized membrane protein